MENIIKVGTVFAGKKSPSIHNEITKVYTDNGKKMVEVAQYSMHAEDKTIVFFSSEITRALKIGMAHIVLAR
jgi:hypothetical protein